MPTSRITQINRFIATVSLAGALGLAPAASAGQLDNNTATAAGDAVEALLQSAGSNGSHGQQGPSGQQGQSGGVSHSAPQTQQATGGGGKFDRDRPKVHWRGRYAGSNDGRDAVLEIKPTGRTDHDTMSYSVILRDQDRGEAFQGNGYVDFKPGSGRPAHMMYFKRPLVGPSGKKTIERLYLHTWDTGLISGTTKWRGTSYGLAFRAR